jgi:serine/threonine protein kinase
LCARPQRARRLCDFGARREVELMKQLGKQQHVVQLVDAYEHAVVDGGKSVGTEVYLLMELCSGGSLADTIAQRQGRPMPDKQLWSTFL